MILYHGSERIVRVPVFGAGRKDNDFGQAFYCTEDIELANEWASVSEKGGFTNCYDADLSDLNVLDLTRDIDAKSIGPKSGTDASGTDAGGTDAGGTDAGATDADAGLDLLLQWMAMLVNYRNLRISSPIERRGKEFLISHYLPDVRNLDYVIGYRADDSYFSFARAFLSNTITIHQLSQAMFLGKLGIQYAIVSEKAFKRLRFSGVSPVDGSAYYPKRMLRDHAAREAYYSLLEVEDEEGVYLSDIIRGGMV